MGRLQKVVDENYGSRRVTQRTSSIQKQKFVIANKQLGYAVKEEFISDAVQRRLRILSGDYKLVKLSKQKYEELESAIRKMNMPFPNTVDFIRNKSNRKKLLKVMKIPIKIEK